jgi:hypothetical protein
MTTLAEDISALKALGHNLERAIELARADRARNVSRRTTLAMDISVLIALEYTLENATKLAQEDRAPQGDSDID